MPKYIKVFYTYDYVLHTHHITHFAESNVFCVALTPFMCGTGFRFGPCGGGVLLHYSGSSFKI